MQSLNAIFIQGNLVADPELRTMASGKALLSFALSHNRSFEKRGEPTQETSIFDVKCWGQLAERVAPSLAKGIEVIVSGRLEQERWTSTDGRRHSRIVIVGERVSVYGPRAEKRPAAPFAAPNYTPF